MKTDPDLAWKANNPLRRWLDKEPLGALGNLAQALGMTRASVHWWMNGGTPSLRALINLQQNTGITPAAWLKWLADRPQPSMEKTPCDQPKSPTAPSRRRSRAKSSTSTPRKRRGSSGSGSTPGATPTRRSLAGTMS
jgi:hypothetical protein